MVNKMRLNRIIDSAENDGVSSTAEILEAPMPTENISITKSSVSFFEKSKKRLTDFFRNRKSDFKYLSLAIPIIAIYFISSAALKPQVLDSMAGTYSAKISFEHSSWNLPPKNTFGIWVNSTGAVAFVNIEIDFDPQKVKMVNDMVLTNTSLIRLVKITSSAEANTTGKIFIVLGLDPVKIASAPNGVFQIADIAFDSSTTANTSSLVSFNNSGMQIVGLDQSVFSLTSSNLNLVLNATPQPSPTPIVTTGPSTTPQPTVNPTPTPTPTKRGKGKGGSSPLPFNVVQ